MERKVSGHDFEEIFAENTQVEVLYDFQKQLENLEQASWVSFAIHSSHETVDEDRSQALQSRKSFVQEELQNLE